MARNKQYAVGHDILLALDDMLDGELTFSREELEGEVKATVSYEKEPDFSVEILEAKRYHLNEIKIPDSVKETVGNFLKYFNSWYKKQSERSIVVVLDRYETPANIKERLGEIPSVKRIID